MNAAGDYSAIKTLMAYVDDPDESHDISKSFDEDDKISDEDTIEQPEPPTKKPKSLSQFLDTPVGSESGTPKKKVSNLVSYVPDDNDITDEESPNEEEKPESIPPDDEIVMSPQPITPISDREEEGEKEDESGVKLPPEPASKCPSDVQEAFKKYHDEMLGGRDINALYLNKKNLKNPSIYDKLLQFCKIDEKGSNFPKEIFDPHSWKKTSYYDALSNAQKIEMDKREKEKKDRTKVDFVSGTRKDESKRKSKWDQSGTTGAAQSTTKHVQSKGTLMKKKTLQL
ncbi:unnamed protein product [Dimorphilus gyrociliatus]|uniref:Uncharacterized protein n=1 Tax=Dimorphilus gyrociliatus TaxID=2664684 RepID=A0A7I8W6W4_9ANNE|nr:unnamed protein product [Dimorphilus gyrociliatus]